MLWGKSMDKTKQDSDKGQLSLYPSRGGVLMLDASLVPYVQKSWTDLNIRTTLDSLKLVL